MFDDLVSLLDPHLLLFPSMTEKVADDDDVAAAAASLKKTKNRQD
jgi:hypothetical protein